MQTARWKNLTMTVGSPSSLRFILRPPHPLTTCNTLILLKTLIASQNHWASLGRLRRRSLSAWRLNSLVSSGTLIARSSACRQRRERNIWSSSHLGWTHPGIWSRRPFKMCNRCTESSSTLATSYHLDELACVPSKFSWASSVIVLTSRIDHPDPRVMISNGGRNDCHTRPLNAPYQAPSNSKISMPFRMPALALGWVSSSGATGEHGSSSQDGKSNPDAKSPETLASSGLKLLPSKFSSGSSSQLFLQARMSRYTVTT